MHFFCADLQAHKIFCYPGHSFCIHSVADKAKGWWTIRADLSTLTKKETRVWIPCLYSKHVWIHHKIHLSVKSAHLHPASRILWHCTGDSFSKYVQPWVFSPWELYQALQSSFWYHLFCYISFPQFCPANFWVKNRVRPSSVGRGARVCNPGLQNHTLRWNLE